jgi:hypothetical protein
MRLDAERVAGEGQGGEAAGRYQEAAGDHEPSHGMAKLASP